MSNAQLKMLELDLLKGEKITPASMQFSSDKFPDKEFEVDNLMEYYFLKVFTGIRKNVLHF